MNGRCKLKKYLSLNIFTCEGSGVILKTLPLLECIKKLHLTIFNQIKVGLRRVAVLGSFSFFLKM